MSKRKQRSQNNGVRKASGGVNGLKSGQAKQLSGRAQESLSSAARSASDRVQSLTHDAEQAFKSYPLGFGAAALAIGFGLGLLIPSTVKEGRWLGESRDQVLGKARALMRDVSDSISARREQQPAHG